MEKTEKICVVGLGYVGLPLAIALSRHFTVVGADTDAQRIQELKSGQDRTGECDSAQLAAAALHLVASVQEAADCTAFIVTAPTPVHPDHRPDWRPLEQATQDVAAVLKKGDLVVFESTVCPGSTDGICIPILQQVSGLTLNDDFHCGYSPERISPSEKSLTGAVKIISASCPAALARMRTIYGPIIPAGLHEAPSIATAEAAKLTENIQRDVDIAITNELAMLFDRFGLDSRAVFDAAATKWNFRRFYPGLVGGHCIGTDSYYLLDRTTRENLSAPVLQAARQANNAVPAYVANRVAELAPRPPADSPLLLMGYSFKENCPDVRNTLAEHLRAALARHGFPVQVCDPIADAQLARRLYGTDIIADADAALAARPAIIVFAVAHECFRALPASALGDAFVADIKNIAPRANWRL